MHCRCIQHPHDRPEFQTVLKHVLPRDGCEGTFTLTLRLIMIRPACLCRNGDTYTYCTERIHSTSADHSLNMVLHVQ